MLVHFKTARFAPRWRRRSHTKVVQPFSMMFSYVSSFFLSNELSRVTRLSSENADDNSTLDCILAGVEPELEMLNFAEGVGWVVTYLHTGHF